MIRLAIALLAICALTRIAHAADPSPVADFGGAILGRPVVADTLSDHMAVHDPCIVQVLPSAQLTDPHGWYGVLQTVPAKTAFPAGTQCRMSP